MEEWGEGWGFSLYIRSYSYFVDGFVKFALNSYSCRPPGLVNVGEGNTQLTTV